MSGGYPKPSSLKWTLGGQEVTTNENTVLHAIEVKITQDWNGKPLKCSVTQTDTFVSLSDFGYALDF